MEDHSFKDTQSLLDYMKSKIDNKIDERILNIYQFGSRVYGTTSKNSDYDFLVITRKEDVPKFSLS